MKPLSFTPAQHTRLLAAIRPIKDQHKAAFYKDVATRLLRGVPDRSVTDAITEAVTAAAAPYRGPAA